MRSPNGRIQLLYPEPGSFPLLLGVLVWFFPGCGSSPEPVSDLSPVLLEATTGQLYGSEEGPGSLVGVFDLAVSMDGFVFVSQPQLAEVTVFAPDGSYSHTVGGRREGPGEFQVPGAVRFIADTLTVLEFRRGISLLSPEGEYLTRVSFVLDTLVSQPIDGEYPLIEVPGSGPLTVSHPTAWNDLFSVPPEGAGFVAVDRSAGFDRVQPAFRLFRIDLAGAGNG